MSPQIQKLVRQVVIPGAMLVLVSVVFIGRPDTDPAVVKVAVQTAPRPRPQAAPQETTVADVRLELLNRGNEPLASSTRNPFRFAERVLPAPAVRRAPPPPQNLPPVFQGPPPPPPIPLRFIGLIEASSRASGRVAIFSDGRGSVMHGREGEIIEGRYRVLRLGEDSVELAYADGRGRQTIRLSGQ